jgi:hypothetical protein
VRIKRTVEPSRGDRRRLRTDRRSNHLPNHLQHCAERLLGVDVDVEIDLDDPILTAEVSPDASHYRIDVGRQLGFMAGGLEDPAIEIWVEGDRIVVDSSDYQSLLDIDPQAELGVFAPGVWFVADDLPAALVDVTVLEAGIYSGTATFSAVTRALGGDVEANTRSTVGALAMNLSVDVDALAGIYSEFYDQLDTEVTVEIIDGLARTVTTRTDLSGIYAFAFAMVEPRPWASAPPKRPKHATPLPAQNGPSRPP